MQSFDRTGRLRIHAVSELTGIPAPTLRAWERRYGIPQPARTASAYRLYSDHDVAILRRMQALVAQGMAAAEAARTVLAEEAPGAPGASFEASWKRLVEAAGAYDQPMLEAEVRRSLTLGSATEVFDRVIAPALVEVGERWQCGALSVAQEHWLTHRLAATAGDLLRLLQPPPGAPSAVLACFPDEEHELGCYGVGMRLAVGGIAPVLLGARTPPDAVAQALAAVRPVLVGLSLTCPPAGPRARAAVDAFARACRGVRWLVGGQGAGKVAAMVRQRGGQVVERYPEALDAIVASLRRRR